MTLYSKIMKKRNKWLSLVFALIALSSCDDVLEEDISGDQVDIIAPKDMDIVEGNTVQFLWNPLEGADSYTLQVYTSSTLELDTIVSTTPYTYILNSDTYQWRIKAENNAYQTQYTFPQSFEVVTSLDLSNQTVVLNNPSNNLYTNNTDIIFTWDNLPAATTYTFELLKVSGSGTTTIFIQNDLTQTSLQIDSTVLSVDAEYQWRVKGVNETSETTFSTRTFYIDTVDPPSPTLLTPTFEEEFNINDVVTFSWDFPNDPGTIDSAITSYYDISLDENFSNIVESGNSVITNFNFTFDTAGTYYWRVRGEDDAGNIGAYNLNGKFIINE